MAEVAEDQIHEVTLTMPFDLSGQNLQLVYVELLGDTTIDGGTANGQAEGNDVTIRTDLQAQGIEPGIYELECKYTDQGTTRELGLEGDDTVTVNDAKSVP